jgi:SAM-dependent methyltransferase
MARLQHRRLRWTSRSYLTYRALWPAIERAVAEQSQRLSRLRGSTPLTVMDIGCGQRPYADLFAGMHCVGLNLDADDASPDVIGDATALPFASACADLVFCNQVLEHVRWPDRLVAEAHRVLRPGGVLILAAPFYWPLHEEPNDYFRYTKHGLAHLMQQAGFTAVEVRADTGSLTQVAVSLVQLLPRVAWPLVLLINLVVPLLQRLSSDCRSTICNVATGHKA